MAGALIPASISNLGFVSLHRKGNIPAFGLDTFFFFFCVLFTKTPKINLITYLLLV